MPTPPAARSPAGLRRAPPTGGRAPAPPPAAGRPPPRPPRGPTAAAPASTGHAVEGGESFGAIASNLFLAPGGDDRDALVGSVERGLLVTDFWYTRILDPRTQVVTGLTRNGVFLIEDGKVSRPVTNLR